MAKLKFSIKEAISFGWKTTKQNLGFLVLLLILAAATNGVVSYIQKSVSESTDFNVLVVYLFNIIVWVVSIIVQMGLIKISIAFAEGKKSRYLELYHTKSFVKYVLVSIVSGIIIGVGFIFLIVPGIILAIKLQFVNYLVVDKDYGIGKAIKASWEMTREIKWKLFVFGLLSFVINVAGALVLLVGLLITIPLTSIATAYVYRKLLSQAAPSIK